MKNIAFGILGLGLLLVLLSGLWITLFPGTAAWTPEKSAEWTKVKDRLHTLKFIVGAASAKPSMHTGEDTAQAKQEYEQVKAKHEELSKEFYGIHDRPYTIARILKWSGISLAAIGLIGWYAANQSG